MSESFSPVTFEEFMDVTFGDTLTGLQRSEYFERHLGKTVVWQGTVAGVWESSDRTISVLLAIPRSGRRYRAFLEFAPESRADLLHLSRDTGINVACRLKDWGAQAQLDRCKLLRVLPATGAQPSATVPLPR
jgi:hypothetical protein